MGNILIGFLTFKDASPQKLNKKQLQADAGYWYFHLCPKWHALKTTEYVLSTSITLEVLLDVECIRHHIHGIL